MLAAAAKAGRAEIVRALLEAEAEVDVRTSSDVTPLMYAARQGSPETIAALIDAGADVNFTTRYGGSALRIASMENHVEATSLLLEAGADPTNVEGQDTHLTKAIREHRDEAVLIMLASGEEVTAYALVVAARDGSEPMPDILASPEAHIDRAKDTLPILERAVRVGNGIVPPRKIKDVPPKYPEEAKYDGVQGLVILEAVIDAEGNVANLRVVKSIPALDQAAMDAVEQWKYEPTYAHGEPVPIVMTVTVSFALGFR